MSAVEARPALGGVRSSDRVGAVALASLRFDAAEKRLVRGALTMAAAADVIRGTVNNRSITRCWVRQWRIGAAAVRLASEPFRFLTRVAARTVAPP